MEDFDKEMIEYMDLIEYDVLVLVNVDFVNSLLNVKWERDKVIFNEVRL